MSYFQNPKKMYVPLSIDRVEARKVNYFFSNKKMVMAFVAILPLFVFLYPLVRGGVKLTALIVVVSIYLILYVYFLRFVILEERRLRKMVNELDDNRISEIDHFWGIDKIGGGKRDDGIIYYAYKGTDKGVTKGLVVKLDRGSTIGVPEGHFNNYRETKEQFLRKIHQSGYDFKWYEIQKLPEIQDSMIEYAELLRNVDNIYHKKLLKLQLNVNLEFSMSQKQRYIDYIVINSTSLTKNFKQIIESILDETFRQNEYVVNPHILNKREVEEFFNNYLMVDSIDSDNIRKSVDAKPFEEYAQVYRLINQEGKEVPIQFMDDYDLDKYGGKSLEQEVAQEKRKEEIKENQRKKMFRLEIEKLNRRRNTDMLSHEEYMEEKDRLHREYHPDNYDPDAKRKKLKEERERRKEERRKDRKKLSEKRRKLKEDKDNGSKEEPKEVQEYDLNDYSNLEVEDEDISLEVILRNTRGIDKDNEDDGEVEEVGSVFKKYRNKRK